MRRRYRWDLEQHKLVEITNQVPEPRVHIIADINPYWDDNMQHDPIYVKSRQHRKQLLNERGLAIL